METHISSHELSGLPQAMPRLRSNERRSQPRRMRPGGDFVVGMLTVLGGLFAIAVCALVLL
jgi:hypothetical protein